MTSHPWRPVPLFRLLLPYLAGVIPVLATNGDAGVLIIIIILWSCAACFVFILQPRYLRSYTLQGALLQSVLIVQGALMVYISTEKLYPQHYVNHRDKYCMLMISDIPVLKKKSFKLQAVLLNAYLSGSTYRRLGTVQLYLRKSDEASVLKYGDCIYAELRYDSIQSPADPGSFNYRSFMERRQVYARCFLKTGSWIYTGINTGNSIKRIALQIRGKLLSFLHARLGTGQEYAVAAALLIGQVDTVDSALMKAFAATGTLHVLSVSGMHVGLIYMLLAAVLGKMENNAKLRGLYFVILFVFLWGYAMITGLSAPVIRSAMMLSLVLTGKILKRKSPVLNTLCGSMLLLLIINPYWITETGFQLSYLAVTGIMVLHPLLVHKLEFSWPWQHKIWELISVSLCAQVITVPVTLMFFGQFPTYFLISNLLIIPLSTIAIYGGIATLVPASIPYAGALVGNVEIWILRFLNKLTIIMGTLPGAVILTPKVSAAECLMLYAIMFGLISWLVNRKATQLMALLALLILWTLQHIITQLN